MTGAFRAMLVRDLRLAMRHPGETLIVLGFFLLVATLFPLGVGPAPQTLASMAAGVVWVAALLAVLLSLDRLFQADYDDGTLDAILTAPVSPLLIVLAKAAAHWLTTGLPLIVAAPVIALLLRLEPQAIGTLLAALALGTPVLTLIGAVGAALTLGARRGGLLLPLLVLPLYIPVLIFGALAVDAAATGQDAGAHLLLLAACTLAALALAPPAAAAALRAAAE